MPYIAIPTRTAQLVRVQIHEKNDLFTATSPDLNILVTGNNLGENFDGSLRKAIQEIFDAMGQVPSMCVIRINHPNRDDDPYWYFAAIPQCVLEAK